MAYGDTALLHARMPPWLSRSFSACLGVERLESLTKKTSRRLHPKLAVQSTAQDTISNVIYVR